MLVTGEDSEKLPSYFNDKIIGYSNMETHLGITWTEDQKARQAIYYKQDLDGETHCICPNEMNGVSSHIFENLISIYA